MILVVDDDKILCALLKNLLEHAGYDVELAYDGAEAYPKLKNPKCQFILLDIRMPGINGAELLMLMAAERIQTPVLVIAGFPDFDESDMKQFPNVRKMFQKPLWPEDILEVARQYHPEKRPSISRTLLSSLKRLGATRKASAKNAPAPLSASASQDGA